MINKLSYYFFREALPSGLCNDIVRFGNSELNKVKGITGFEASIKNSVRKKLSKTDRRKANRIRKSNIAWLDEPWINREVEPYIHRANKEAGWNYSVDGREKIQFTEYKKGQFYDYHQDYFDNAFVSTDPNMNGKYRKISMTVNLTDPKEYKGGQLHFRGINKEKQCLEEYTNLDFLFKGTVCVFPSFEFHKVTPVTEGVRHSLVIWSYGKAFQ